jgi:hypothetical protein
LIRGLSLLQGFTGLIPLVVMVPILLVRLYAVGIAEGLVLGSGVLAYHLVRRQGVTSIDLIAIGFSALNAALYFGFADRAVIANIDIAIYTLVAATIVLSLIRRRPWTEQFARRMVPPYVREDQAFRTINMSTSFLWAVSFVACDAIALSTSGALRRFVPIALLVGTAAVTPPLVRHLRAQLTASKRPARASPDPIGHRHQSTRPHSQAEHQPSATTLN